MHYSGETVSWFNEARRMWQRFWNGERINSHRCRRGWYSTYETTQLIWAGAS